MRTPLLVAVSQQTLNDVGAAPTSWLRLAPIGEDPAANVLWRRQSDRTAWVAEAVSRMPRLAWLHTDTAGVDRLPLHELCARSVIVTNARGAHTPAVSEWALGAMLLAAKRLHETVRHSDRHQWTLDLTGQQLADRIVLILGVGSIGTALARACCGLGMQVIGVSRRRQESPYLTRSFSQDDPWLEELHRVGFLVNCLPLTERTRMLINARVLGKLSSDAWLINVGRGETVDEDALVEAVMAGALGGAILDTVRTEPLPAWSRLWGNSNVIIASHRSSFTDQTAARTQALFISEAERYRRGESLVNVVDFSQGY